MNDRRIDGDKDWIFRRRGSVSAYRHVRDLERAIYLIDVATMVLLLFALSLIAFVVMI